MYQRTGQMSPLIPWKPQDRHTPWPLKYPRRPLRRPFNSQTRQGYKETSHNTLFEQFTLGFVSSIPNCPLHLANLSRPNWPCFSSFNSFLFSFNSLFSFQFLFLWKFRCCRCWTLNKKGIWEYRRNKLFDVLLRKTSIAFVLRVWGGHNIWLRLSPLLSPEVCESWVGWFEKSRKN